MLLTPRTRDALTYVVGALCRAWSTLTAERLRTLTGYAYLEEVRI